MYKNTKWLDRVVDKSTGEVLQEGTGMSAGNFNNMEDGIGDAAIAAAMLMIAMNQGGLSGENTEVITAELTNTESYPFNNSEKTIPLSVQRLNTSYTVHVSVLESDGNVGDVTVSDKLINGFKIKYDGSAKRVRLELIIKGGMAECHATTL
ncbi:MAG: hypothetical protein J6Q59_04070 [Paludibacteraceae bacterium]|nr:hypothetical protein [Paludibacteraceae bacterium]